MLPMILVASQIKIRKEIRLRSSLTVALGGITFKFEMRRRVSQLSQRVDWVLLKVAKVPRHPTW